MALTPEQIDAEAFARWGDMKGFPLAMCRGFARAIEAEVRKQDDALILQLVEALEGSIAVAIGKAEQRNTALIAGRAWLGAQHSSM